MKAKHCRVEKSIVKMHNSCLFVFLIFSHFTSHFPDHAVSILWTIKIFNIIFYCSLCSAFRKGSELFYLVNLIEHNERESAQQKLNLSNIYFSLLLTIENFPLPPSNSFSIESLLALFPLPCFIIIYCQFIICRRSLSLFFILFLCAMYLPFRWPSMTFRWFSIKQKIISQNDHRAVLQKFNI